MPSMLDKTEIGSKRMCPVIFLIDTSLSMSIDTTGRGHPIGAVNAAIENSLPELISMNEKNADAEIKIAVLSFDSDVEWVTGETGLISPEDLQAKWKDLDADGLTFMGAAFKELNQKLSVSHGFMQHASGSVAPVLFLLSDGEPNDDYKSGLKILQTNNWYKVASKVAIGYGDSNDDILREFTGNIETVLHTNDPKELLKLIQFVTITSSTVASSGTKTVSPDDNAEDENNPIDTDGNTANLGDALQKQKAIIQNAGVDDEF